MGVIIPPGREDVWRLEKQMETALMYINAMREEIIDHRLRIQELEKEIEKLKNK